MEEEKMKEVCKVTNCLFFANIECSCNLKFCKLHYKKHSTENLDHRGHKILCNINEDSKKEILNFLFTLKLNVSQWGAEIKAIYVKKQIKFQIKDFSYLMKSITDIINNCAELIMKVMKTSNIPIKVCYNPIEYFLIRPLSETKKYVSELNLNISRFKYKILSKKLVQIQNHLYNYNYLYEIKEDFHGGEIQKEKELIIELFNIAGSLLNDDEYYNSKYLYKECRKILEKVHYHKQIDFFFIDYYIYMIKNRINPNCEIIEPTPRADNVINPYFVEFLDFISSLYINWGKNNKPREFLKKNIEILKLAFISYDHLEGWLCFCKGIVNLHIKNFEKSDAYFKASKIYFKRLRQFDYLALMYYYLGFLYNSRFKTDTGFNYSDKSKKICKKYKLFLLLEKVYFWRGYLCIYQLQFSRAERYLKKGRKLLNGPGKRYDVALIKLNVFSAKLQTAYDLLNKIKGGFGFSIFPIQNQVLGWLYSEVGFLYFLFGDLDEAEKYFCRVNLDSLKASDMFNLINASLISVLFYIFTFRIEKAEEALNILAKKYEPFNDYITFFIDTARIWLKILSPDKSLKTDEELEKVKVEINKIELPIWFQDPIKAYYASLKSLCNVSNWNELLGNIFEYLKFFSNYHPLVSYVFQVISKIEENLENYEKARECLFVSLESLKKFVSPKNPQLKRIEEKISEIEKIMLLDAKRK